MASQIIYSIDNTKKKFEIDSVTGTKKVNTILPEHEYDLVNLDTHFSDGRIHKANESAYNKLFIEKTMRLNSTEKIRQFLHHHLKHHLFKAGTQSIFFQKLKDLLEYEYSGYFKDRAQNKEIILRWIEEESKGFEERIFFDTTFNEPESNYQCQIREKDIKDPTFSYHDLVENAFKSKYINNIFSHFDDIEKFLDHHYKWYEYDKNNWLKYTKKIIKEYKALHKDDAYHDHTLQWIAGKQDIENNASSKDFPTKEKTTITEKQQGLIFYYLNWKLKFTPTTTVLEYSKFVELTVNKKSPKPENSNLYNYLRNPFQHKGTQKSIEALVKDFEFVKQQFKSLGQIDIVNQIEMDMKKLDNDLNSF